MIRSSSKAAICAAATVFSAALSTSLAAQTCDFNARPAIAGEYELSMFGGFTETNGVVMPDDFEIDGLPARIEATAEGFDVYMAQRRVPHPVTYQSGFIAPFTEPDLSGVLAGASGSGVDDILVCGEEDAPVLEGVVNAENGQRIRLIMWVDQDDTIFGLNIVENGPAIGTQPFLLEKLPDETCDLDNMTRPEVEYALEGDWAVQMGEGAILSGETVTPFDADRGQAIETITFRPVNRGLMGEIGGNDAMIVDVMKRAETGDFGFQRGDEVQEYDRAAVPQPPRCDLSLLPVVRMTGEAQMQDGEVVDLRAYLYLLDDGVLSGTLMWSGDGYQGRQFITARQ